MTTTTNPYLKKAVETASPARLVLMLYDGAVASVGRALDALGSHTPNLEAAHRELVKTQNIVTELRVSLDPERGGAIAASLAALYDFCHQTLVAANVSKKPDGLPEVEEILRGLRDAWAQACCPADALTPAAAAS